MDENDIIEAYTKIRKIDNTIPDEVLDFMKRASLEKLHEIKVKVKSEQRNLLIVKNL